MLRVVTLKARLIIAAVLALVMLLAGVFVVIVIALVGPSYTAAMPTSNNNNLCGVGAIPGNLSGGASDDEQIENARLIDAAAASLGLSGQASRVAIIAAYGESTLFNIDYGDGAINPDGSVADSLGLFQQQPSQGWGTVEQVTDPTYAATSFFLGSGHDGRGGLVAVGGWQLMEPTQAIHLVQVNADPNHYARFYSAADQIIAEAGVDVDRDGAYTYGSALGGGEGEPPTGIDTSLTPCGPLGQNVVGPEGWAAPSNDPITSASGMRADPINGSLKMHWGVDYSAGCGTPIYAANGGVVSLVDVEPLGAWEVRVDSGDGYVTRYVHMEDDGIFVEEGDEVAPGEQIAVTGSSGWSTGCHLHFEIFVNGENVQPETILAEAGLPYQVGE